MVVTGSWPYIKVLCSRKYFESDQYLKNFHKLNKNASVSLVIGNCVIRCLKHDASIWLLQPIHCRIGTTCSRCLFKQFVSPELMLVVSIHANLAFLRVIFKSLKNIREHPLYSQQINALSQLYLRELNQQNVLSLYSPYANVAYIASCFIRVISWIAFL